MLVGVVSLTIVLDEGEPSTERCWIKPISYRYVDSGSFLSIG